MFKSKKILLFVLIFIFAFQGVAYGNEATYATQLGFLTQTEIEKVRDSHPNDMTAAQKDILRAYGVSEHLPNKVYMTME